LKILFLATYFPRPLNPTIGTWALEQAKAFARKAESGNAEKLKRLDSASPTLDSRHLTLDSAFRVVSGNSWFPKIAGKMKV
jgi:hypothetical protein